jgi:uncharacterized protein YegJ (DUF2314 family)
MNNDPKSSSMFDGLRDEPLFMAVPRSDPAFQTAYDGAAATIPQFIEQIQRGEDSLCSAKLRFRDPDESERLGENRFLFLWLTAVHYHTAEGMFSGVFFEVPLEFQKWHQIGQRLAFETAEIFDWMVLNQGHLHGGFTLRVAREKLPEADRESHDRYLGVLVYEPLPV